MIDTPKPITILECQNQPNWSEWQTVINGELDTLLSRNTFAQVMPTPSDKHLIGYKRTFVCKHNDKGQVVRCKARLLGKGFTQQRGIHYDETYSPNGYHYLPISYWFCYIS